MTMRKIVRYDTVTAENPGELAQDVEVMVNQGWEPFGSHTVMYALEPTTGELLWSQYTQAIVRYEDQ